MQFATVAEAIQEWAYNVGHERPECAWICSDYDTWERNPYYRGPPVEHPEVEYEHQQAEAERIALQNRNGVDMVWLGRVNEFSFGLFDFEVCRANGCVQAEEVIPF